jgi:hypothetical protein
MTNRLSVLALFFAGTMAGAQQQASHSGHHPGPQLSRDDIAALARVQVAIIAARDSVNVQRARPGNKTMQAQQALQEKLRTEVQEMLKHVGLTDAEYQRRTFVISTDTASRRIFDSVVVAVTGAPLPGYAARAAILAVPAGPVGVHLGHVMNGFNETPSLQGLLPAALAEARIAIQHATLAGRQPENLEYMKTHVGHVVHALDPTIIKMGPGMGYGVKKATAGAISHIEMAAAAEGASPNVVGHSKHVVVAAKNTLMRVDQLLALAQQVQSATVAAEASKLISQIVSLAEQLVAGADTNGDGRVTYDAPEGGLQVADEHVRLMLRP